MFGASFEHLLDEPCEVCGGETVVERRRPGTGARKAFRYRLFTTPGVAMSTNEDLVGAALRILTDAIDYKDGSDAATKLETAFDELKSWIAPNGDTFAHALQGHKWMRELSCGFYNDTRWPCVEDVAHRLDVDSSEAQKWIDAARWAHSRPSGCGQC